MGVERYATVNEAGEEVWTEHQYHDPLPDMTDKATLATHYSASDVLDQLFQAVQPSAGLYQGGWTLIVNHWLGPVAEPGPAVDALLAKWKARPHAAELRKDSPITDDYLNQAAHGMVVIYHTHRLEHIVRAAAVFVAVEDYRDLMSVWVLRKGKLIYESKAREAAPAWPLPPPAEALEKAEWFLADEPEENDEDQPDGEGEAAAP